MLDFILDALVFFGSALGLLIVLALWALIIFVVVNEVVGLYQDLKDKEDDHEVR